MLETSDILNYNGSIWIAQDLLVSVGVDYNYIRTAKSRAKAGSKSWQHERIANRVYFDYASLTRTATALLDSPEELARRAVEARSDVAELVQRAMYTSFKLFLNHTTTDDEARARAVVHEAANYCLRNKISFGKSAFFEALCNEIEVQSLKHLPRSWRNMRNKVRAYHAGTEAATLVRAKNTGNKNRLTHTNNQTLIAWLVDLGAQGKNYSAAAIYRKVDIMCATQNIPAPSDRWVRNWLSDPATQYLLSGRYGSGSRFNHKYRSYTPTQNALYAGDCWDIDGTRVQLISHTARVMVQGKLVTKQKYLYIIAVRDVHSGDILGWEYCYDESAEAVTNAIAMAVRTAGYLPYEMRYDRFPGHNTHDWIRVEAELQRNGVVMTQTSKAEGKAGLERWWGTMQDVFMPESDLYYGQGVRSTRRHAHRSKEYVAKMNAWAKKEGFSFDDACNEFDNLLATHAATPYNKYSRKFKNISKSPAQLHDECNKPNTYPIGAPLFAFIFGLRKEVSIRNYMIQTEINGATYYYGIDDVDVCIKYTGIKLCNCFDHEDLDTLHLYDGYTHLGTYSRIAPAQQYGPNKDMRAVGKTKAIGAKMAAARKQKLHDILSADTSANDDTGDVEVMLGGRIPKALYEAAETAMLMNDNDEDEGEDIVVNSRKLY